MSVAERRVELIRLDVAQTETRGRESWECEVLVFERRRDCQKYVAVADRERTGVATRGREEVRAETDRGRVCQLREH